LSNEEEDSVWFAIAEKALGLLIILIGVIVIYSYTLMNPVKPFSGAFTLGGLAMIIVGAFMFLSRIKQ
jgi:membrane-bound ClpP family serine protease